MIIREIQFGSEEFRRECELRQRVLRAPIGLNLYEENLDGEKEQFHFGLFDGQGKLVACVIAVALSPTRAKIRQMAVAPDQQGKGCGRLLLESVEATLARRGLMNLSMHARKTAVGFYQALGYATSGGEFTEVGLPHLTMEKCLTAHP